MRTTKETVIELEEGESIHIDFGGMRVKISADYRGDEESGKPMLIVSPFTGAGLLTDDASRLASCFVTVEPD